MGHYIPSTAGQRRDMLTALGLSEPSELFRDIPQELKISSLNLPRGQSELETERQMTTLAAKNTVFPTIFRGAGAYRHYIPAVVSSLAAKETLLTAYTPYQAEISQGILQSIFEYQTMICLLTGLDVSNASVYDGATAAAEAAAMCRDRKRSVTLISAAAHPNTIAVVQTYAWAAGAEVRLIPHKDGVTDLSALEGMIDGSSACVLLQQPNYFGMIEPADAIGAAAHAAGAKFIMSVNPIAAALLKTPAECGADIAVGEGQPLGLPLSFGGPYLGFMATTTTMARRLPGRIVGQTADAKGRRAFVLTLQAREQHIRREKAGSNICSNQALCAMTAACYLAAMGPQGLREAAIQSMSKAHYLADRLSVLPGYQRRYTGEFFHEFVTECPDPQRLLGLLESHGILGGLPVDGGLLWCVTEMNTMDEIDRLATLAREVTA